MNSKVTPINSRTEAAGPENRSVSGVLHDMKDEASQFVQTRFALFKAEMQEKLPNLSIAAMMGAIGALLLVTSYALLTLTVVSLVAAWFKNSDYRWVFGFLSISVLWGIIGGIAFLIAKREFSAKNIWPTRTIAVLKGDKTWLEQEAKKQG
jgi:uncharacterized membrane protein YqjE